MYYYVVVKYGDTSERRIILKFPTLNLYLNLIKKGFWGTGIGYNVMETSKILQVLPSCGDAPFRPCGPAPLILSVWSTPTPRIHRYANYVPTVSLNLFNP